MFEEASVDTIEAPSDVGASSFSDTKPTNPASIAEITASVATAIATDVSPTKNAETLRRYNRYRIQTDSSRNALLTTNAKKTLDARYMLAGETYQDTFARPAITGSNDKAHAERLYKYISLGWFTPATPGLTNLGAPSGLPISCFLNEVQDSMKGIVSTWTENVWLGVNGGGTGSYWGNVRSLNEAVGLTPEQVALLEDMKEEYCTQHGVDEVPEEALKKIEESIVKHRTSGIVPFLKVSDSLAMAISQGGLRRAMNAAYLPVWHPEIEDFIDIRRPTGGDPNRKAINLHHGVCIPDEFMVAVQKDADWNLISPKDNTVVRTIKARMLFIKILTARMEQGEPYILYVGSINTQMPWYQKNFGLTVKTSNLCVSGETRILTRDGYKEIASLAGQDVVLWNGREWSLSRVEQTGTACKTRKIEFSNGSTLWTTDQHHFYVKNSYHKNSVKTDASSLIVGDKIEKWSLPVVEGPQTDGLEEKAYASGFFSADGTYTRDKGIIWCYGDKISVIPELHKAGGSVGKPNATGRIGVSFDRNDLMDKFHVPLHGSLKTRLSWLAGYLDGDGSVTWNDDVQSLQFSSINPSFMNEVRLLLNTLGVDCSFGIMREEGYRSLPDGKGGKKEFYCQESYRSCVAASGLQHLLSLGLECHRLETVVSERVYCQAAQFVTVISNGTEFREEDTFCANEPIRHRIILEGTETGNCAEITLPTGLDHLNRERTAVCCLGSVNLTKAPEYWNDDQFWMDVYYFLDNVLDIFIADAPEEMANAVYFAQRERSIGLGFMGWHDFLQERGIPYESVKAAAWARRIDNHMRAKADMASYEIAKVRGPCLDALDAGVMERFACKQAIAPTASISIITGCSPGNETLTANAFVRKTIAGTMQDRNPSLERLLQRKGMNTDAVWSAITTDKGSVLGLDFLSDEEKSVFKTATEINHVATVRLAALRTGVCQSQATNIFLPADIHKKDLALVHMLAWLWGVKSLYYCRSVSIQRADAPSQKIEKVDIFDEKGDSAITGDLGHDETVEPSIALEEAPKFEVCLACQ